MRMKATDNRQAAEAQIDALHAAIRERALPRAINELTDQVEVARDRKIAEVYDIPKATMAKYTSVKYSSAQDLEASLTVKGRGFPLSDLKPQQTALGVTVMIKKRRVLVPHAFMVAKFGRQVFARGAYGAKGGVRPTGETFGRFVFGRGRLPINKLYSFAPPDCQANPEVRAAMDERVESQAPKVLARELRAVVRGF